MGYTLVFQKQIAKPWMMPGAKANSKTLYYARREKENEKHPVFRRLRGQIEV